MKAHTVNETQHTARHTGRDGTATVTDRLFHLLYNHNGIAIIDVPGTEFLAPETALALAYLIASDPQLAALIRQQQTEAA